MSRKPAHSSPTDGSGRDSRLKLLLLSLAFLLVAGYAVSLTDMERLVSSQLTALAGAASSSVWPAGLAVAGLVLAAAFLVARRRRFARPRRWPAEAKDALALEDRSAFLRTLAGYLDSNAKAGRQLAVHLIDIDRFHVLNEVRGEAEGNIFLRMVAERLLVLVNRPDRLARIGDDEFAIIQPEAGGARHAEIYAKRIQETLKDASAQIPRHARPGASIGAAVSPEHGADAGKLVHNASLALRAAKRAGGDTIRLFGREMEIALDARRQMEKAISDGLHHGWFELYYQPQYDLGSRRLTGFEALVRMNHPELGIQLPEVFLPVAEESGLMQPLGEWIIRDALATAAKWPAHLTLSLNLSLVQFRQGDIAAAILNAQATSEFEVSRLKVEIPEAVLLEDGKPVQEQLRRLKSRGVGIVLDDFGLNHSILRALSRTRCDAAKIDRTLVDAVVEDPETEKLVRSLIATARAFGLAISAEGVERPEQVHFLMSNACGNVQGFLLGRPAPAAEIGATIARDVRKAVGRETGPSSHASNAA